MSVKKRVFVVGRLQGLRSRPASTCASIFKMGKLDHPSRTAAVFLSLSLFFCLSSARSYEEDVAANHREFFEGTQYFKEVIDMSRGRTVVRDRTKGPLPAMTKSHLLWRLRHLVFGGSFTKALSPPFDIGRFNECRPTMYTALVAGVQNSAGYSGERKIHVGIDIGGPPGTAVRSFLDCKVLYFGYNPAAFDYGHVIVTQQVIKGKAVYALYGHLSAKSVQFTYTGKVIKKGELVGWLGVEKENGGWPPHLHLQFSLEKPEGHDMPGVVSVQDHQRALEQFPDPRWVIGDLYDSVGEGQHFFGEGSNLCT